MKTVLTLRRHNHHKMITEKIKICISLKIIRYKNKPAVVFRCYGLGDPKGVLITGISQNLWEKLDKN